MLLEEVVLLVARRHRFNRGESEEKRDNWKKLLIKHKALGCGVWNDLIFTIIFLLLIF